MRPDPADAAEAWGVFNPGGTRGPDGHFYLFPRRVAVGNYSRVGRARVLFDDKGSPVGALRLDDTLEPCEPYELAPERCGGVEDSRVSFVRPLGLFVMTYTAYRPPLHPRVAMAVSEDLAAWTRLGPIEYAYEDPLQDLNVCDNKNAVVLPDAVRGPTGESSIAILHRPTYGVECSKSVWISYVPLDRAKADIRALTRVAGSRVLMSPREEWEQLKIGAGAPPVRLECGWLLLYHGVSGTLTATTRDVRYCVGVAILDLDDPTRVVYRSTRPILEPVEGYETHGVVANVVFPTAADFRADDRVDVYYGAADNVIAAASITIRQTSGRQNERYG
jgi:predicted GH43/DUF377 family glycosyl hydrolase